MKEDGVIETLLEWFEKQQLTHILGIKQAVDRDVKLSDYNRGFLEKVCCETKEYKHHIMGL